MREPVAGDNPSEDEKDPEQSGSFSYLDPPPGKFTSRYANIERRITGETAFPADELSFSSMPRPTHWSVAWSDLMMTMFILFLCLFVYKSANEDFLGEKKPEIIGGDTTEALQSMDLGQTNLPIVPLKKLPLMTAGTIKKVVKIPTSEPPPETNIKETPAPPRPALPGMPKDLTELDNSFDDNVQPAQQEMGNKTTEPRAEPQPSTKQKEPEGQPPTEIGATDQSTVGPPATKQDTFAEIYKLSKETLEQKGVASLADVELVPDKTMRIILTSDLLFGIGQSELSTAAQDALHKIGEIIKDTPYMINIVGHTDNTPMVSSRFASNWELSVARASTVARYLINSIGMNPDQFVVSGYASYRPLVENTTADNRAKNRRVEIIISRRLPQPQPATPQNLN